MSSFELGHNRLHLPLTVVPNMREWFVERRERILVPGDARSNLKISQDMTKKRVTSVILKYIGQGGRMTAEVDDGFFQLLNAGFLCVEKLITMPARLIRRS